MIKSFYLTILLFMITQLAYSQSIEKVNGQVQNEKKEPIVGAIVILSKAKTDRLIKSTFTDVEGKEVKARRTKTQVKKNRFNRDSAKF